MPTPENYRTVEMPRTIHRRLAALKARTDQKTLWQTIAQALDALEDRLDVAFGPPDPASEQRKTRPYW